MPKILNPKAKVSSINSIDECVAEYIKLREQENIIKKRKEKLSALIKQHAEKYGTKDDKGSYYSENENFVFGKQAKKSVSFDQEKAILFLENHGFGNAIITEKVVDEIEVEKLVAKGKISFSDIEDITTVNVTYAVDVRLKEEIPEVQTANLAASRKKR